MFTFFKKKTKNNTNDNLFVKIAALLIHAGKIDQNYNYKEKDIIKRALIDLGVKRDEVENVLTLGEKFESNSNQIIEFTKEIKKSNDDIKIKIIEVLWKIIYSDDKADIYETNLMRRLTGLLYLDSKIVGKIREKIINNLEN